MKVSDLKIYKDSCYSALSRDLTEFEKNFLLVASGILAFSTSFIKDIVKISEVKNLSILFGAWACIIIAIGLMMKAFLKFASASDKLLSKVDLFEIKNFLYQQTMELSKEQWLEIRTEVSEILRESKLQLKTLRNRAVVSFLVGIVLLSLFVSINLLQEKHQKQVATSQETKK
jgi:hypothetical protein